MKEANSYCNSWSNIGSQAALALPAGKTFRNPSTLQGATIGLAAKAFVFLSLIAGTNGLAYAQIVERNIESNVEQGVPGQNLPLPNSVPFQITIDGEVVAGAEGAFPSSIDDQRAVDVGLDRMDIHVKYDGLDIEPQANIEAQARTLQAGSERTAAAFFPYWNYGAWTGRAEVRIFPAGKSPSSRPLAVLNIPPDGFAKWLIPTEIAERYSQVQYVLRIYGKKGRFDETQPKFLNITLDGQPAPFFGDQESIERERLISYGKNSLSIRNIDLYGGSVTVYGENIPETHKVYVLGKSVPISSDRKFVIKEIVPPGSHNVTIAVLDPQGKGIEFQRNLTVPYSDVYYVALADITVGKHLIKAPSEDVEDDESGNGVISDQQPEGEHVHRYEVESRGRLAFYAKGKILGKYILTAAGDTGDVELKDLVRAFDRRDPYNILNRIDPNKYYSVFGDDSSVRDDAPTSGPLYVRLERGDSHAIWGNFSTSISDNDLAPITRSLYGAKARWAAGQTDDGEKRFVAEGFAALPGTLAQIEEFRGTGGSVYFLAKRDIHPGSERVTVEIRNPTTSLTESVRKLVKDEDYRIDPFEGRILLTQPLPSSVSTDYIASFQDSDELEGNPVYLVVHYEHTPSAADLDGYTYAGRSQGWIGEFARLGVQGYYDRPQSQSEPRHGYAADVLIRPARGAYAKAEYAKTYGPGVGTIRSNDGGFSNEDDEKQKSTADKWGEAYRAEIGLDLAEMGVLPDGNIGVYAAFREKGFTGAGYNRDSRHLSYGANASARFGIVGLKGRVDQSRYLDLNEDNLTANVDATAHLAGGINAGVGLGYSQVNRGDPTLSVGGRLGYRRGIFDAYVGAKTRFATGDSATTNDQALENLELNAGAKVRLFDRLTVGGSGRISDLSGDRKWSARASADWHVSDRTNLYLAYKFANSGNSYSRVGGTLAFGGRTRFNDYVSLYGEQRLGHEGEQLRSLTSAYGVKLAPSDNWVVDASFEAGRVTDLDSGHSLRRIGGAGTVNYISEGVKGSLALEARRDTDDATKKTRDTYAARTALGLTLNPSWRLRGGVDAVYSEGDTSIANTAFVDSRVGFAYRPVDSGFLNALLQYRAYLDLPTEVQENAQTGARVKYKQRSHILLADGNLKVLPQLTLGAKYGLKWGQRTTRRNTFDWYTSILHQGIVRADFHIAHKWDVLAEGRALYDATDERVSYGALLALYRHLNENFKIGVGYNFGQVTDDLTNVESLRHGVFVNAIAKF